jgi:hypothetical protein
VDEDPDEDIFIEVASENAQREVFNRMVLNFNP